MQNILIDSHGNVKISDFGFATLNIQNDDGDDVELLHSTCGTPNYVAPEVIRREGYNGKIADIWSAGVILFVLIAGFLPFEEETTAALFMKIKAASFFFPSWFSTDAKDLVRRILVTNPKQRFTLAEIKSHVWMASQRDQASSPPTSHLLR